MKRLYFLLALFCLTVFAGGNGLAQVSTNGLVAHYKMDGDAQDASGNGNHGTAQNGVTFDTDRLGVAGKAASFDGVNDYVEVNHSASLNNYLTTGELTISYWINPDIGKTRDVIAKRPPANNGGFVIQANPDQMGYDHVIFTNAGQKYVVVPYTQNEWQHIVFSAKAGDAIRVYKNGVLSASLSLVGNTFVGTTNNMRLMANTMALELFQKGKLDQVQIFSRILSNAEIQALYQAEAPPTPPTDLSTGLVAHYKMDGNAQDASGNGNHGAVQNGVTFAADRFGNAGKAASFDGVNGRIMVNNHASLNFSSSFSSSFWVKMNVWAEAANNARGIISKKPNDNSVGYVFYKDGFYQSKINFRLKGNAAYDYIPSNSNVIINQWEFWTMVYNSTTGKVDIFKNGVLDKTLNTGNIGNMTNSAPLYIGFSETWTGYFNGSIDDVRIYNRALSDAEVAALYALENSAISSISIVKLPEDIYQTNYNVLQQSIVHRYYQVRSATNDQPIAGVVLKYKLSNRPNEFFESTVSDAKGLVDLKIPIGGNNQLITNDDLIPAGVQNVAVSFESATATNQPLNVNTNQFNANDFTISAYTEQQPEEKEYGIATGIGALVGLKKGVGFKIGPIEGEAGLASASVGATYGGIVTIKPDLSNHDIWEVAINGTSDYEAEISLGPKIELEAANVISAVGGVYLNASILSGKRNEHVYNINLNQFRELYYTAYKILLMKSNLSDDRLLRAANFFRRMSENISQSPLSLASKGKMSSIGLNASLNSNIGISSSIAKNSNISAGIEFGAEVSGELALESKNSIDVATNEDINEGSVTMGVSASAGFSTSLNQDLGEKREATFSVPTPLYFSASESITLGFERKTLNNLIRGFSTSFESNKSLSIAGITYEVDYTNELELNTNLSQAVSNYYRTNPNVNNLFGKYLSHGKFGFVSMQNGFSSNNNFYNQFVNFSKKVGELTTISQGNNPFIHRLSRTYTNKFGGEFEFSVALGIELGLNLNLEGWSSYTSTLAEYTYLPSVQQILKTMDRPLNDSFITLPTQNPFEIFFDRVKTRLLQESTSAIQAAYDSFVQKIYEPISTTLTRIFTNSGASQLALSGEKLNKVIVSKNNTNSQSPSVLTFNVPPAPGTFNAGTEVRFSYFYPENQLKAPIGVDTFQIVSDVFYLNALVGQTRLATVPNGNFTVSTNFSTYDLSRASLPLGSMVKLIFKQEGTNNWIIVGDVNATISYNRLGVFAIAAKLQTDRISPEISIVGPTPTVNSFVVTINEAQSGINWSGTSFVVNGQEIAFTRNGTTNTFNVSLTNIPMPTDGVYRITVSTSDLAYNTAIKNWKYPCEKDLTINSVISSAPFSQKVSGAITINANVPQNSNLSLQAGKSIIFGPGFEMKNGKTMKAEVKGCEN